jgi:hypothetical protein
MSIKRHECPVPSWTSHGYTSVDIIGGFCEAGIDCIKECPYSYTHAQSLEVAKRADEEFKKQEALDKARGLY